MILPYIGTIVVYHVVYRFLAFTIARRGLSFVVNLQNFQGIKQALQATRDDLKWSYSKVRREQKAQPTGPHSGLSLPEELVQAITHLSELPPSVRAEIYRLWTDQARLHAQLARKGE